MAPTVSFCRTTAQAFRAFREHLAIGKDHSRSYHIAVFDELQFASNADEGRVALGELKDQILSGVLPL